MKRKNRPVRRLCAAGLLAVLAAMGWYENYTVRVLEQPIVSARLPEGFDGFRIVQISDLHAREFGKDNEHLVDLVRAAKPDLIALTGDLADEDTPLPSLRPLLAGLTALAPVYYVTGNHEWVISRAVRQALYGLLDSSGVIRLENDYRVLERDRQRLVIAGVDDPNGPADQKTAPELIREIGTEKQLVGAISVGYPAEAPLSRPRKPIEDILEYRV